MEKQMVEQRSRKGTMVVVVVVLVFTHLQLGLGESERHDYKKLR